jgi:hypothetical protein
VHPGLIELVEFMGRTGVLVALSFAAFLLGSSYLAVVEGVRHRASEAYPRAHPEPGSNWRIATRTLRPVVVQEVVDRFGRPISHWSKQRMYEAVFVRAQAVLADAGVDAETIPDVAAETARRSVMEIMNIGPRLLVVSPELFQEFDRRRSEAELRDGLLISLPVACWQLMIALDWAGLQLTLGFVGLLLLGLTLLYVGDTGHRRAYSMVAHSIASGTVDPASLQELREKHPPMAAPRPS